MGVSTDPDVLSVGEAAALCGVSRSTLRRAIESGRLQAWRTPGGHSRIDRTVAVAFARQLGRTVDGR